MAEVSIHRRPAVGDRQPGKSDRWKCPPSVPGWGCPSSGHSVNAFSPRPILGVLIVLGLALAGCAGQYAPSGGPVDKSSPKIIFSSPSQKELNFRSKEIILRFDKYMSQRSVESALYFPPLTLSEMSFNWSGKELKIKLQKALDTNRTYILTIGTAAIDLRNNYLGRAYNLVFSTGEKIDTGTVVGHIYGPKPQPYTVAAFPVTPDIDTLRPWMNPAKYVTQSDDSGSYVLQGLANGRYRLICFDDQMRNFTYAPQMDLYASATHDIDITGQSPEVGNVDFIPATEDTSLPQLYSADLTKSGLLVLKFSEPIDTSYIEPAYFVVRDSVTGREFRVDFAARLAANKYNIAIGTATPLPLKRKYFITAADSLKDSFHNLMSPHNNTVVLEADSATMNLAPYYLNFVDSSKDVTTYDTLYCQFISPAIASNPWAADVTLFDSAGRKMPGYIRRTSQTIFRIETAGLSSFEWYTVELKYEVGAAELRSGETGGRDSIVTRHFQTVDFATLGDIEGHVSPTFKGRNILVSARRSDGKAFVALADTNGQYKLDRIPAGMYTVSAYIRHNSSSAYFSGRSFPYRFAEPFGFYPDEVKVRARWTTDGVLIKLH